LLETQSFNDIESLHNTESITPTVKVVKHPSTHTTQESTIQVTKLPKQSSQTPSQLSIGNSAAKLPTTQKNQVSKGELAKGNDPTD
jgi:hypothetical protein